MYYNTMYQIKAGVIGILVIILRSQQLDPGNTIIGTLKNSPAICASTQFVTRNVRGAGWIKDLTSAAIPGIRVGWVLCNCGYTVNILLIKYKRPVCAAIRCAENAPGGTTRQHNV